MKRMIKLASLIAFSAAAANSADRNLIPTLSDQTSVCPDQPSEPEWMRTIEVKEAYKRLLVQQIYRADSMQRIVDAQSCECSTRFPPWDTAESAYLEVYATAEYWDVVEATSAYRRRANELRKVAMPICENAGNW